MLTALGALAMPAAGESLPGWTPLFFLCALALGVASAAKATLIYAGEPVWTGVVGLLAGERIPALAVLGAALIIFASIIGERRKA